MIILIMIKQESSLGISSVIFRFNKRLIVSVIQPTFDVRCISLHSSLSFLRVESTAQTLDVIFFY